MLENYYFEVSFNFKVIGKMTKNIVTLLHKFVFVLLLVVDCGSLPDPVHGKKTKETKTTFGGRADFICKKKRYSLIGSRRRFCQVNGEWSGRTVVCKGIYNIFLWLDIAITRLCSVYT